MFGGLPLPARAPGIRSWLVLMVLACVLPGTVAAALAIAEAYREGHAAIITHALSAARVTMTRVDAELRPAAGEGAYRLAMGFGPPRLAGQLPWSSAPEWIVVVFDSAGIIAARSHGADRLVGTRGAPALLAALDRTHEGVVETESVDGVPILATFTRSEHSGWAVAVGVPRSVLMGRLQRWLLLLLALTASLCLLGGGTALWLSRRIAASVQALVVPAAALSRGEPVAVAPLPLHEADRVANALASASRLLHQRTSERDEAARQNAHLSRTVAHDPLTGLVSRSGFRERLDERLSAHRSAGGGALTVFYLDLDDFKPVNDRHGHAVGDELLRAVAARLRSGIREGDVAARLGGDEFAVLIDGRDPAAAVPIAAMLIEHLSRPYAIRDLRLTVSACIGIAGHPADGTTVDELLDAADRAMYRAKSEGKGDFRCTDFTPGEPPPP